MCRTRAGSHRLFIGVIGESLESYGSYWRVMENLVNAEPVLGLGSHREFMGVMRCYYSVIIGVMVESCDVVGESYGFIRSLVVGTIVHAIWEAIWSI